MTKLIVFADDLTGALDTAVQFTQQGISTEVCRCHETVAENFNKSDILVVNTDSRHLTQEEAYGRLKDLTVLLSSMGVIRFYKKTDSALRGNLGSEFSAVMDGANADRLYFLPAYPQIGRTTHNGIQYYHGVPLMESDLARDLLSPVMSSYIPEILGAQLSGAEVTVIRRNRPIPRPNHQNGRQMFVLDADTDQDLKKRSHDICLLGGHPIMAGCAGFARYLPKMLHLKRQPVAGVKKTSGFLFVCGSLNPISQRQLIYAEKKGFERISLAPEQKLNRNHLKTPAGGLFLSKFRKKCESGRPIIIDMHSEGGVEATDRFAQAAGIAPENISQVITECIGELAREWVDFGLDHTLMISGGDTLMGLLDRLDCRGIRPVCEIFDGVVLSQLILRDRKMQTVTKSGGFGDDDDLIKIWKYVTE